MCEGVICLSVAQAKGDIRLMLTSDRSSHYPAMFTAHWLTEGGQ